MMGDWKRIDPKYGRAGENASPCNKCDTGFSSYQGRTDFDGTRWVKIDHCQETCSRFKAWFERTTRDV